MPLVKNRNFACGLVESILGLVVVTKENLIQSKSPRDCNWPHPHIWPLVNAIGSGGASISKAEFEPGWEGEQSLNLNHPS